MRVDGGPALAALGLDVPAQRRLLAPARVVAKGLVAVLLADRGQGSARRRPARRRLLAHRVEQLLGRRRAADHALREAQQRGLVAPALTACVARGDIAGPALPLLEGTVLAVAQIVVRIVVAAVLARAPHPRREPGRRNRHRHDQRDIEAERAAVARARLAPVVAVVVE